MSERLPVDSTSLVATTAPDPQAPHLVLWNTAAFYGLRPELAERRVVVDHHVGDRLVGSFVGGRDGASCCSGTSAPFGGLDLVRSAETVANVEGLVDATIEALADQGVTTAEVKAKPPHYGANESSLTFVLLNRGFVVEACDLNFFLDLTGVESADDYGASLKPAARKMLRRSQGLGLDAFQVDPADEEGWAACYEVLRANRVDRGRPMRLPLEYICAIRDAFPGLVRLLALADGGAVCAAALVYRVAPGHDLVQYWGDAHHALPVSPMNALVRTVVEHSLAGGARMVDIGISSEDGAPNHGLIQFKRSVGCDQEPRLVLTRSQR